MNLTKIENTTPVREFPDIYNGNIDELVSEINRLNQQLSQKDDEIENLRISVSSALNRMRSEYIAMFDTHSQDNICDQAYVTPVINPDTLVYEDSAKLLVTSTTSYGTTEFYLGYKKDSPATSDSQITWGEANATTLTAEEMGKYHIYYKYTANAEHCGNKAYTKVGIKSIKCNQASVTPVINSSTLKYNTHDQNLVTSTSSQGINNFYLGYKMYSEATSDSQITWGEANAKTLKAKDIGIYYIYYKYTADDNHCGNKTYTKVGTKEIEKGTGTVNSGSVTPMYVTYSASPQTVKLETTNATGTVTFPTSVDVNGQTWSCTTNGILTIPANTCANKYTVRATVSVAASDKYNASTKSLTWYPVVNCEPMTVAIIPFSAGLSGLTDGSTVYLPSGGGGIKISYGLNSTVPGTIYWDTDKHYDDYGKVERTFHHPGTGMVTFGEVTYTDAEYRSIRACFLPDDICRYCIAGGDFYYAGLSCGLNIAAPN